MSESENPAIPAPEAKGTRPHSNRDWWPNQPELAVLRQQGRNASPYGEGFDYRKAFAGLDLEALRRGRRTLCRTCIDWSERRPHISGALGAEMLRRFGELGWVKARDASRALVLTATGEHGLADIFGIRAVRTGA